METKPRVHAPDGKGGASAALEELSEALARTDDPRLIRDFLLAILTDNEVREVSSRWALVRLIDDGMSQRDIARNLGLSLCKITRGSRELKKDDSAFRRMVEAYKAVAAPGGRVSA